MNDDRDDREDREDRDDRDDAGEAPDREERRDDVVRPAPRTTEGVRILGAEEAQAAIDGGATRRPFDTPARPPAGPPPARTGGPTWSASDEGILPAEPPEAEAPPLPHWSEPPTGAMPAIFAEGEQEPLPEDDDLEAWVSIGGGGPRFRAEGSDWADADFAEGELTDEHTRVGALAEAPEVDEDEEFERDVAARRRVRRAGTSVAAPPRPARSRAARETETTVTATPPSERDLPTALLTAGIIACLALGAFALGRTWTAALSAAVVGLAALELCRTLHQKGFHPATPLVLVASVGLVLAAREYGGAAYPIFFALTTVASLVWFLWEVTPGRPVRDVAATLLAFGYVGGLGGFAGLLLSFEDGVGLVLGVVICAVAYDVFGYFVGSQFGRQPIAPRISPNKTVGGTVGGVLASVVFGAAVVGGGIGGISPWDTGSGFALGVLVGVGAFIGDLCESMLKRDLGIKDFGALLPGHGGFLDRFDAILFCLPVTYYLAVHLAPF